MLKKPVVIYLASQSPRRRYLIRKAGYTCRVIPSSYREIPEPFSAPKKLVLKHAKGKLAKAAAPKNARFVVAADTVVALRGRIYGKPKNLEDAVKMLGRLTGKKHAVYTGWAIQDRLTGLSALRCIRSGVKIKKISEAGIRAYFKKMNPLDKAGSYAVQSKPSVVEKIEGSYSNVMGFPMEDFGLFMDKCLNKKIR